MSASNAFETLLLAHILQNANVPNLGDATGLRGSVDAGILYVSLHIASPGEAGNQSTNEADYTGYERVAIARTAGQWTVTGNTATNANAIAFGAASAGSNTITHFGIGLDDSGAGTLLYYGALVDPVEVISPIRPLFDATKMSIIVD